MGHQLVLYIHKSGPDPAANAQPGATNRTALPRLSRIRIAFVASWIGVSQAGCSIAIGPLLGDSETTGSSKAAEPISNALDGEDWRRARAAMAVALDRNGDGAVVHWDNPMTQANGAFTPIGEVYSAHGRICRSFTADITTQAAGQHLQGEACRGSAGEWTVSMINNATQSD
jgi:surface antigen